VNFNQRWIGEKTLMPVGSYEAGKSPFGAYDMAGNVWEWVNDFYDFRGYLEVPTANPPGVGSGLTHVVRGGSWLDPADLTRATVRSDSPADSRNNVTGFRCALSEIP
jgi:formylglycine-generating enzyme required for sulfatase activity